MCRYVYLSPREPKQVSKWYLIFCADKIKTLYIHSTKLLILSDANSKKEHICFLKKKKSKIDKWNLSKDSKLKGSVIARGKVFKFTADVSPLINYIKNYPRTAQHDTYTPFPLIKKYKNNLQVFVTYAKPRLLGLGCLIKTTTKLP